MNKDLILLQKNNKAAAAIVLQEEYLQLGNCVSMKANVSDKFLFSSSAPFAEKLEKHKDKEVIYFVISNIDNATSRQQERYVGLVKDREFNGYNLPKNCIIVFTVDDKAKINRIIPELYKFCIVAI